MGIDLPAVGQRQLGDQQSLPHRITPKGESQIHLENSEQNHFAFKKS
jgi:hypothetical protein